MLRLLLFELFAFATPFMAYGLYVLAMKKKEDGEGLWQHAPVFNLSITGLLLVGSGIIGYGLYWS